jgi:hypothetical protein
MAWLPVSAPSVLTKGSVLTRFHSFSAPRLASVCSTCRRTAQAHHVGGGVAALDALPAGVLGPVLFEGGGLLFAGQLVMKGYSLKG